jgi:putative glycosyl hydrolase protein
MPNHEVNRRLMLKALGYGSLAAMSAACGGSEITFVTPTSPPAPTPSATPVPVALPVLTDTPEPTFTPEPSATIEPVATQEPTAAAQEASLFQPAARPSRIMGMHIPYGFLTGRIDYGWLEEFLVGTGANSVVIDIKSEGGSVAVPFDHYLKPNYLNNLDVDYDQVAELISWLNSHGYYPVARQVVMSDTPLVSAHADLGYTFYSPSPYVDTSGQLWLDPERPEVGDYNGAIAVAAAQMGFQEIQLDYIRFPEANFNMPIERRVGAIANILRTVLAALNQRAVLTIDVLDDSTNNYPDDIADGGYGQHLATLALIVDGICPMLYPDLHHQDISVDYYQNVFDGTTRTAQKIASTGAICFINPWIQAYFAANLARIRQQARGAFDAGSVGVFAWNISLNYPYGMYNLSA